MPRLRTIWESAAGAELVEEFRRFAREVEQDPGALQSIRDEAMPDATDDQVAAVLDVVKAGAIAFNLRTEHYLDGLFGSVVPLAQHFASRPWRRIVAVQDSEFLVSDCPVTAMAQDPSRGLFGVEFVTVPIDRRHALILGPVGRNDDEASLDYGPNDVAQINGPAWGSAVRWVYAHPGSPEDIFDAARDEWMKATGGN